MVKITDDGLLATAAAVNGAWALTFAVPSRCNPVMNSFNKKGESSPEYFWGLGGTTAKAIGCASIAAQQLVVGLDKDAPTKTKKNALKVTAGTCAGWAAYCGYHAARGNVNREAASANAAVNAAFAGLCLWQSTRK